MTDPRRQRFAEYIRLLADMMGLRDWRIVVSDDGPTSSSASASNWLQYGARFCRISLSDYFLNLAPEEQREDLVHELIHCHLEPMDGLAKEWLEEREYSGFLRLEEYSIDGIATAWAKSLPLPLAAAAAAANTAAAKSRGRR